MNKYRIGYDMEFIPPEESIFHDGEKITSISLAIAYIAINKETGEEIFFSEDVSPIPDFGSCYNCNVNKEKGYEMVFQGESTLRDACLDACLDASYTLQYKINGYTKWIDNIPEEISHEEFMDILMTNIDEFCIPDNMPAQELACYTLEVLKE